MSALVTGRIWFQESAGPFTGATLRIKIENVSRVDAAAREVCNLVIPNRSHAPGDPPFDFALRPGPINSAYRYELRVHLDLNGDGEYTPGDQITMQSYPVLTCGYPNMVQVHLRSIE
jgi:Type III secretion system lipoprotein chaperone (YscW)